MSVLTPGDHACFRENGYLVVRNAAPKKNCDAVIVATFEFLGMDAEDPNDWYRSPLKPGGAIEIYHVQAMWDNRQHRRIYQAFAEVWGTERLWTSIDRVNFKPPPHPDHLDYDVDGFLHWDYHDVAHPPIPFSPQGVLCLTDTADDQGGFHCLPGAHKDLMREPNPGEVITPPDLDQVDPIPIPARAGDLIIWHRALPHGNGRNRSSRPRWAQYISMGPAQERNEESIRRRIASWKQGCGSHRSDPTMADMLSDPPIRLTALGRKLLGLDSWEKDQRG